MLDQILNTRTRSEVANEADKKRKWDIRDVSKNLRETERVLTLRC